jgi:hypothetical protein
VVGISAFICAVRSSSLVGVCSIVPVEGTSHILLAKVRVRQRTEKWYLITW